MTSCFSHLVILSSCHTQLLSKLEQVFPQRQLLKRIGSSLAAGLVLALANLLQHPLGSIPTYLPERPDRRQGNLAVMVVQQRRELRKQRARIFTQLAGRARSLVAQRRRWAL